MSNAAKQEPKYPWDVDIPDTPFWADIDHHVAQTFLQCFAPSELAGINFDDALPQGQKLQHLRDTLEQKAATAPTNRKLQVARSHLASLAGDYTTAETIIIELCRSNDEDERMNAFYNLAQLHLQMGQYAEAEARSYMVLPWIQGKLGTPDSPQTMGLVRGVLVPSVWKQGRVEEAKELVKEAEEIITRMEEGKFKKYVGEEREELARVVRELEQGN